MNNYCQTFMTIEFTLIELNLSFKISLGPFGQSLEITTLFK